MKLRIQPVVEINISECERYCEGCDHCRCIVNMGKKRDLFWCGVFSEPSEDGQSKNVRLDTETINNKIYILRCDQCKNSKVVRKSAREVCSELGFDEPTEAQKENNLCLNLLYLAGKK